MKKKKSTKSKTWKICFSISTCIDQHFNREAGPLVYKYMYLAWPCATVGVGCTVSMWLLFVCLVLEHEIQRLAVRSGRWKWRGRMKNELKPGRLRLKPRGRIRICMRLSAHPQLFLRSSFRRLLYQGEGLGAYSALQLYVPSGRRGAGRQILIHDASRSVCLPNNYFPRVIQWERAARCLFAGASSSRIPVEWRERKG